MNSKKKNPHDNVLTDNQIDELKQDAFDAVKSGNPKELLNVLEKLKNFQNKKPLSKKAMERLEEQLVNLFNYVSDKIK